MSDYESTKESIRAEFDANEGHPAPDAEELWSRAKYHSEGAASWIGDMPVTENEIATAKDDVLRALVALEMAEERLE